METKKIHKVKNPIILPDFIPSPIHEESHHFRFPKYKIKKKYSPKQFHQLYLQLDEAKQNGKKAKMEILDYKNKLNNIMNHVDQLEQKLKEYEQNIETFSSLSKSIKTEKKTLELKINTMIDYQSKMESQFKEEKREHIILKTNWKLKEIELINQIKKIENENKELITQQQKSHLLYQNTKEKLNLLETESIKQENKYREEAEFKKKKQSLQKNINHKLWAENQKKELLNNDLIDNFNDLYERHASILDSQKIVHKCFNDELIMGPIFTNMLHIISNQLNYFSDTIQQDEKTKYEQEKIKIIQLSKKWENEQFNFIEKIKFLKEISNLLTEISDHCCFVMGKNLK